MQRLCDMHCIYTNQIKSQRHVLRVVREDIIIVVEIAALVACAV